VCQIQEETFKRASIQLTLTTTLTGPVIATNSSSTLYYTLQLPNSPAYKSPSHLHPTTPLPPPQQESTDSRFANNHIPLHSLSTPPFHPTLQPTLHSLLHRLPTRNRHSTDAVLLADDRAALALEALDIPQTSLEQGTDQTREASAQSARQVRAVMRSAGGSMA